MKFIKRSYLRRKLLSLKGRFLAIAGYKRKDGTAYYKNVLIINQTKRFGFNNLLTVLEINKRRASFKSIALEGVRFFLYKKDIYYVCDF